MQAKEPLLVALSALIFTAPAVSVELTVQVVNRTADAPPPPALTVVLQAYVNGQEGAQQEAQTDSRHRAVFQGLTTGEGNTYVAQVSYEGVKYESRPTQLTDGSRKAFVEVPIYETTPSSDALQVQVQHTVLRLLRGALEVDEMYLIENPTDRTYVGRGEVKPGARRVLEFMLPAGFTGVQLGQGLMACCIVAQKNGFVDTMEVKPGQRMVQFKYLLPYTRQRLTFRPSLLAPTQQYSLLVSSAVSVSNLWGIEPTGEFNTGNQSFLRYAATNLAPSMPVSAEFSGLPVDRTPLLRWLALAVAGSLVLVLGWWVLRSKRWHVAQRSRVSATDQRTRLLEEIVQLDELFEAGKLTPTNYQLLRNSKKAALAMLGSQTDRPA